MLSFDPKFLQIIDILVITCFKRIERWELHLTIDQLYSTIRRLAYLDSESLLGLEQTSRFKRKNIYRITNHSSKKFSHFAQKFAYMMNN